MFTAPEIPALPSNTLTDAIPNVNPINQNVVDPMFTAPEIPALPSNTLADAIPNDSPINQNVVDPMFTAPEIPVLPSNTLADAIPDVNLINQNEVDAMFTAPEIPALPSNTLADAIPNVNPINQNVIDPMFTAPEIPTSNSLGAANLGIQPLTKEKTNAAFSISSPERPVNNPINAANQDVQTDLQGNTFTILDGLAYNAGSMGADTMKPTVKEPSSSAMLKNTPTERITGAILFPGNWDETKQKNYQSLDLVNHSNDSSIGQALNDSLLQPVENTINSELIKPVEDTLNLETVDATPVLSAQISNGVPTNQAEVQNLNGTRTAAGSIVENKVDTMVNNVIDNADMTAADQVSSKGKMDATQVETDSSLISVPLLRSKINLNSNNISVNSINELSSDNDFLTALKGILPVIAQNLNKTETDKITETNVTEAVVGSNQSSLPLEIGSQLFSNSRPENIVESNQSSGRLDTESQLVSNQRTGEPIESNQSNGNIQTGSQLLSISRAENTVESNQSSGTLEAGSQLFSNTRKSFNIDSMNSDMGPVGRNALTGNEMDSLSSFKKSGPSAVLSTPTVSSSDSTISQEKTSGLVTDTVPTRKVADSIINSFLQDGLLRLSDEVKQQSTESVARTQSVMITTNKPEISTSSNKVTTTVDSFVRNNGVPASASSIDIKTVRIEDQPPQERSSTSIVSETLSSEETTSSRPEESASASSASTEGHGEPTAEPTPEPTSSTSLPLTERLSINMSKTPLAASSSIRNDKQADATTTTTVSGLSVTPDISIQTDTTANSTQTTAAVKPTAGVLSVNSGVDTKADIMVTEFPTDLFNAAIANPDAFAPRVISGLVTETIEPPTPEPIPDFPTDLTMSNVDLNVDPDLMQPIDSDLAFTIVSLLKNLTDQSVLQTTSKSGLNDTSAETATADAAMLDNRDSHQVNKTQETGDIAFIRNVDSANTEFETAIIAEIPEGDNKTKANRQIDNDTSVNDTMITTSETKTANTTKVVSDTNIQTEIKDNITEPSDTYAKPMLNDVIGDKTQTTPKTVQTTKKAYSVVVDTERNKQFESNIISNEADTSFSSLEDDHDLFGIDRQSLSKYCIIILTYERFTSTDI